MELNEVKIWTELNIHDYNTRQAFLLITEIIYNETEDKVTDIEMYWNWFKEKWKECEEIISQKDNWQIFSITTGNYYYCFYSEITFLKVLNLFYNVYVKSVFCINKDLLKVVGKNLRFFRTVQKIVKHKKDGNRTILSTTYKNTSQDISYMLETANFNFNV